jgi:hypothetical protein
MSTTKTPPTYVAFRAAAVAITLLVLLLFVLGLRGSGPLHSLGPITSSVVSWLHGNTRVSVR